MKGIYIYIYPLSYLLIDQICEPPQSEEEVVAFFKKRCVVTWEQLTSYFGITRQAIQRIIKGLTHLTSLNRNRRFLVLKQFIGKTNQHGICSYRGIVFSISSRAHSHFLPGAAMSPLTESDLRFSHIRLFRRTALSFKGQVMSLVLLPSFIRLFVRWMCP